MASVRTPPLDDTVIWTQNKTHAIAVASELRKFLAATLALTLGPKIQINRTSQGIPFCGYRIYPGTIRLNRRRQRRYRQIVRKLELAFALGQITAEDLQARYSSILAMTIHANSTEWRRNQLARHSITEA